VVAVSVKKTAPLYSLELLGDATQVALRLGGTIVSVRADKFFKAEVNDIISIDVRPDHCHLFDPGTGLRLK